MKFGRFLEQVLGPLVGVDKGSVATNLVGLTLFAVWTHVLGTTGFGNRTEAFLARAHAQNRFIQLETLVGVAVLGEKLGLGTISANGAQYHEDETDGAEAIDGSC